MTAWRIASNNLQFERAVIQFNLHINPLKVFFFLYRIYIVYQICIVNMELWLREVR